MLELREVDTFYGAIPMLSKVSLQVGEGETVCILGANGAGKTTLLKTIIGLIKPISGGVYYMGARLDVLPSHQIVKRGISFVPENEALFPNLSVESNLRLGAYHERDKKVIDQRMGQIYELFPRLNERKKQGAGTLSGGERKMLYIGMALLPDPKVILFDEPSLGLAPALVNEVFETIDKIKKERGISILLVEQNASKALHVSERGYVLQKGQIVFEGTVAEIKQDVMLQKTYLGSVLSRPTH